MTDQIKRINGKNKDITTLWFESYDEDDDLLANIYENICCSDEDYDDWP